MMQPFSRALRGIRNLDTRLHRRPGRRRILVDARTPVNYTIVAPVVRRMEQDPRVEFWFTASEEPGRTAEIYREALGAKTIHPRHAALKKFDAYVVSDFMWALLPRGTRRVQVFHGVAGKYGFDTPTASMREWDRLFFVNERRLRNFIAAGAIDEGSPAIRLVGMPKVDCLVDGTYERDDVIASLGLDPRRPTVLYAPTWSPASSLNAMGEALVTALVQLPINLVIKLHDRSLDLRQRYSGGIDWAARLQPLLPRGRGVIAPGHDISPYLVGADAMITDHSSAGFEFLLRDRPIIRIDRPALIELAKVHPDYVHLLASVSDSVSDAAGTVRALECALADPLAKSADRRTVAEDLFYMPGSATTRSVDALYEVIELEPIVSSIAVAEHRCQPSA